MSGISCRNLSKSYGSVQALICVDLRFADGKITAVVGPNGAGKSTLVNVLSGFVRADHGNCFLGDADITRLAPYRIARMGIARTFQDARVVTRASTVENVMLAIPNQIEERPWRALLRPGKRQEKEARNDALGILRLVGLEGFADRSAGELSYGQQKTLTLACCVATRAQVLLLDEPIAGVDSHVSALVFDILRRQRSAGKQVVLIEHDLVFVRETADVVVVMDEGKIIAEGPPNDVLERREIIEAYFG